MTKELRIAALEAWLADKNDTVKETVRRYPPGTQFRMHGKLFWMVAVDDDGALKVSEVSPIDNYDKALETRQPVCKCCMDCLIPVPGSDTWFYE